MAIYHIRPDRTRPPGWEILSIADIHFFVQPSFLFFIGIIFLLGMGDATSSPEIQRQAIARTGLYAFIIFFSLLIHEAGHAVMVRLFGFRDVYVSLIAFGGYTQSPATTRGRSLLITAAGPLASIALAAAGYWLWRSGAEWMRQDVSQYIAKTIFFLNTIWAVFNLLPIFPMDGGRMVLGVLGFMMREGRALLVTAFLSLATCAGLLLFYQNQIGPLSSNLILLYFVFTFVMSNVQIIRDQWRR